MYQGIWYCLSCTPTCSVAVLVLQKFVFWPSTKEVKMFCPTRFVLDATGNSNEGGVATNVCSFYNLLVRTVKGRLFTYCIVLVGSRYGRRPDPTHNPNPAPNPESNSDQDGPETSEKRGCAAFGINEKIRRKV